MGWKVIIGGALTVDDENLILNISSQKRVNDKGTVDSVDWNIEVEADIVASTASAIADAALDLNDQVVAEFDAKSIQLQQDGVEKVNLQPSSAFIGPFVTDFHTISEEEGSSDSHWRCRFTIIARMPASDTAYDLDTSISIETVNGEVVRKTWTAHAKSKTAADALAKVLSFKPGEKDVRQRVTRWFERAEAEAVWVWERRRADDVVSWRCTVSYFDGGKDYIEDTLVDGSQPNMFDAVQTAMVIEVKGTIIALSPPNPPSPHFSSSSNMRRATRREIPKDFEIENEDLGKYRLDYHEVWIFTGTGNPPSPNHSGGHNLISTTSPPGDGAAAS